MVESGTDPLADVVRREHALLDPRVRVDAAAAGRLLHPDFLEYGRSGRVWDRDNVLAMMTSDPGVSGVPSDFAPVRLADDVVLLTYRSADGTRRSSVWVRGGRSDGGSDGGPDGDGSREWVLRFHQGTPPMVRFPSSVPACTLTGADQVAQVARWRTLLAGAPLTRGGLSAQVELDVEHAAAAAVLIRDEQRCCPFLAFRLDFLGQRMVLTVSAPDADAMLFIDALLESVDADLR